MSQFRTVAREGFETVHVCQLKQSDCETLIRKEKGHLLCKMSRQDVLTDGLLSQRKPELTGLQSHVLIRVLRALQHVLYKQTTSSVSLTAQDLHHFWVIKISPQRYCACEGWVGPLAPPAAWPEPCTRSCAPPSPHLRPAQTDSGITGQEENRLKQCNYSQYSHIQTVMVSHWELISIFKQG